MTGKQKLITGIKIGVIITAGSVIVGRACKAGIEYYRRRNKQIETELIFEEESL